MSAPLLKFANFPNSIYRYSTVMLSMELQPTMHIQHINHHSIVGSHGLTSLSQSGQHHPGLLHHQHPQQQQPQHHNMLDDKQSKSKYYKNILTRFRCVTGNNPHNNKKNYCCLYRRWIAGLRQRRW